MKYILLQWTYYADIIIVPDYIEEKLSYYQVMFDTWISDKSSNHNYWNKIKLEGEEALDCLCFDTDAFITWLNEFIILDEKKQNISRNKSHQRVNRRN